uniref:Ig-like domain-containing protein n=1 Tax=Labrus bergylta TaxID=56723 RepID=A0A3Q3FK81_9LABR
HCRRTDLIYLTFFLHLRCKGEDRVIQPTEDVFASEGDTVTLDCTFETTRTSPTLFWYRQKCNDFPRYMLKSYSDKAEKASEFQTDRFNAAINGTSVPLKIQKLQLTDSAVYYCALSHSDRKHHNSSLFKHTFQSLIEISKLTFQGGAKLLLNYTKKRNFNIQHTAIHDTDTLLHSACSHCIFCVFSLLYIFIISGMLDIGRWNFACGLFWLLFYLVRNYSITYFLYSSLV